jgi:hypothetical protein
VKLSIVLLVILFTQGCQSMQHTTEQIDFTSLRDGKSDCTAFFQKKIDDAGKAGGGVVQVPPGNYLFKGRLTIPAAVTLSGVWTSVPSHTGVRDQGKSKPTDDGTTFLVTADKGTEDAPAFITVGNNAALRGVVIYYPDQSKDDVPTPYPWAIAMRGDNASVQDCELLNPYNGIDATQAHRHLIRNVHGQPLRRGIYVDQIYDIGRIENVHFNPWFSMSPKQFQWQMDNGEAFVFGRTDWQYVTNTFCYGYKVGYRFIKTKDGACNGNFLGIGADDCQTAVVIDESAPFGLLITNGEFVSFRGDDPTMIRVSETHTGVARFVNCAFWGPCRQNAIVQGKGIVGFSDCTFVQWDEKKENRHAIQAHGGTVLVRGCSFAADRPQVQLDANVKRAVITDNIMTGALRIENRSGHSVVANNLAEK